MQLQVEISNKQILRIALPVALSILVPNINYVTNNIFLGHLSEQALPLQVLRVYIIWCLV